MVLWSGGMNMHFHQSEDQVKTVCYPSGSSIPRRIAGIALIVLGVLIILLCVPFWAWWGLLGAALIAAGLVLTRNA